MHLNCLSSFWGPPQLAEENTKREYVTAILDRMNIGKMSYFKVTKNNEVWVANGPTNKWILNNCRALIKKTPNVIGVSMDKYLFNQQYNSCWGKKLILFRDGSIKPCFFYDKSVANINLHDSYEIERRMTKLWRITMDKIMKCKVCEFKYICYDCRALIKKITGRLFGNNPYCSYGPGED